MSQGIVIAGTGAVSAAGWGTAALLETLAAGALPSVSPLERGVVETPVRRVPESAAAVPKAGRLRRASPISKFAAAAALEALGPERLERSLAGGLRIGVLYTLMNGCVNYSNRFFGEVLQDPSVASPILFPETVFNAPGSHLSSMLGSTAPNDTLIGDGAEFFTSLEIAAEWISSGEVDGCLVVGSEEIDWLSAEALRFYSRNYVPAEGAGALYLERGEGPVNLLHVPDPVPFSAEPDRVAAARRLREAFGPLDGALLVDGCCGVARYDAAERAAWADWNGERLSPRTILGEMLGASAAVQCVVAAEAVKAGRTARAVVTALGGNEQAAGALFGR